MSKKLAFDNGVGLNFDLREARGLAMRLPFPDANRIAKGNEAPPFSLTASSDLSTPRYFALSIDDVMLPNEPLISVRGSKTIVKTRIANSNFTVKEIIGLDDWKINIKGYAVREGAVRERAAGGLVPDDYPEEWLRKLITLFKSNRALKCQCQLLSYFNISSLVIEDVSFPPVPGAQGFFAYEINAISDTSPLVKLKGLPVRRAT
jgi:hypothetical protein